MEVIFLIVILIMSVVLHEVAHGYTAALLGDLTARLAGRLTLNPLKHLDWFGSVLLPALLALLPGNLIFGWAKPVPYNPYNLRAGRWGPAYVALAGPATNLLIALCFSLVLKLTGNLIPEVAGALISLIILVNLMLTIFNLIPVPPLDGSKILFAIIPPRYHAIENWLTRYQFVLLILVIVFVTETSFISRLVLGIFTLLTT